MNLSQLECPIEIGIAEELSSFLEEEAFSVAWYEKTPESWFLQVIFDPPLEPLLQDKIKFFFKEKNYPLPTIITSSLPQKDWVEAVYRHFPPLTIGRFYIYGSHLQQDSPPDLLPLRIDAATAFGSGQHESTEGCLRALSLLADQKSFSFPLDMGCGSGILALAMARLWNVKVLACDNDPEAVRVTKENAHINALDPFIETQISDGFSGLLRSLRDLAMTPSTVIASAAKQSTSSEAFDLITANILAGPLCQMAPDAEKVLMPRGYIVLSGLLNRQAEDVIDAYRSAGIKLADQLFIGDWSTLIMRKEDHE